MANLNYLIPQNINVNQNQQTPADAFLRGMAGPLALSNQITQNSLAQLKLKQFEDTRNALAEYSKTQNPEVLRGTDPELHMKVKNWIDSQPPETLKELPRATAVAQQIAPMLSQSSWSGGLHQKFKAAFPNLPPEAIPGPDATDAQLFQWANSAKLLDAQLKQMVKEPKVVGRALVSPTGQVLHREAEKPFAAQIGEQAVMIDPSTMQPIPGMSGPKWNPKEKQGVQFEQMPDGTFKVSVGGSATTGGKGAGTVTGLQPQTIKEVEKGLMDVTEALADTHRIAASFSPKLATLSGQWEGTKSRIKDKLGYQLDPDAQKQLDEFTNYRAESGRVFANTLKKLSGTAVTEPEMKRQEVYLINPGTGIFDGDSPSQVKSKIDTMVSFQRNAIARLNYIRKNGLSIKNAAGDVNFANIPLTRMPGIIKGYGQMIATKLMKEKGYKADSPELIQAVQAATAEHFGLVQ